jgi:hypothetical protein
MDLKENECDDVDSSQLTDYRVQWWIPVNTVLNILVS